MGKMFWLWTLTWIATWIMLFVIYFVKGKENKK